MGVCKKGCWENYDRFRWADAYHERVGTHTCSSRAAAQRDDRHLGLSSARDCGIEPMAGDCPSRWFELGMLGMRPEATAMDAVRVSS